MIGTVLGSRYEIVERIGKGGMAFVYKANCSFLNRPVAVKVLQPQYVGDADFLRRFRREAQAAASLSHPNIVSIYDVGQENEINYIVMEYVSGKTLKDKIRAEAPLAPHCVIDLALQIGSALEHAHANDIVHCDIKPHNILLTEDGRVKVTDFGLARAVSSSTLTYQDSVMGSVHYFSPEQAHGELAGKQSDLYSLGIVMYEMVTGKLPFEGESPITVALKHIQAKVEEPRHINPGIPEGLERVILHAIKKDPQQRYHSAAGMLADLRSLGENLDFLPEEGGMEDDCPTQILPAVGDLAKSRQERKRSEDTADGSEPAGGRKKARAVWTGAVIAGIVLLAVALYFLNSFFNVPVIDAPRLEGMSLAAAEKEMSKQKLDYRIVDEVFSELPANHVVSQTPPPGEKMKITLPLFLVLSKGPEMVPLPNVVGFSREDAELTIINAGLTLGQMQEVHSSTVQKGYVIEQNPRADIQNVMKETMVYLSISAGPEPVALKMPDFIGSSIESARMSIAELKLQEGVIYEDYTSQFPAGMVIAQSPGIGTPVAEGTKVDLTVSRGGGGVSGTLKRRTLSITVPSQGPDKQQVRVEMIDAAHFGTLDVSLRAPGERYDIPVEWVGNKSIVKVYINGIFLLMKEIE
ncbi:MAG: Stk1 family PASTA domain-containing Ser/Thr kinase [bacterium]